MDLDTIRSNVRLRLGLNASDPALTDADLAVMVNSALRQADNMRNWWWNEASRTFSTAIGTSTYARSASSRKSLYMAIGDQHVPFRTKLDLIKYADTEGRPAYWTDEGGLIKFYPTPDDVFTVTEVYQAATTDLSAGTDTPLWPDWAVDLIVLLTAQIAAAKVDPQLAQVLSQEMSRIYEAIKDETHPVAEGALPKRRTDWRP